jgi:glycosyltransferase 2 family protein
MKVLRWSQTKGVRLTVCMLVSAVCLYLAVRGMDFERTVQELRKSSPTPILGAVFFLFVSYWIRAYRWRYLLLPVKQISTRPLFRSTLIGFMGNYLFPFRAGEVMRAVSIGQTQDISKAAALGSILLERVFDGVVLSLTPFLFLAVLDLPPWVLRLNLGLLTIYVTGLLILMLPLRGSGHRFG